MPRGQEGLDIAVVGTGIAGMSAAWLLSQAHRVTVYEKAARIGGHSNTVTVPRPNAAPLAVDMGFVVYNERTYPNLTALFDHLGVPTRSSDMSFAVSLDDGALEYAATDLIGLFAQPRNFVSPRFWSMLRDLLRFYRDAPRDIATLGIEHRLGDYLRMRRYGAAFIEDHLLPMAAAIWSTSVGQIADHPASSFIRFCDNHGLLRLRDRPDWRTVVGGSRTYVDRLTSRYNDRIRLGRGARIIERLPDGIRIRDEAGAETRHDHVVIAAHADEALAMLADPSREETAFLGAMRYGENETVMHSDPGLMPQRRKSWASWNYLGTRGSGALCVTYWMNRLQGLPEEFPVFVTLNPHRPPAPEHVFHRETYMHPIFDGAAMHAQRSLGSLQGQRRSWFCGAYFGSGFHEDGLSAGLAVAEALGGVERPWKAAPEKIRLPAFSPVLTPLPEALA